jgi:hypothetical protein
MPGTTVYGATKAGVVNLDYYHRAPPANGRSRERFQEKQLRHSQEFVLVSPLVLARSTLALRTSVVFTNFEPSRFV